MNLRKLIHIGAFTLLLGGLSSCITDDLGECPEGQGGAPKNYYYIHLNVISPSVTGTRSETLPGGGTGEIIPGTSKENQLVSAHLYFCDTDYNVLADFKSDYVEPIDDSGAHSIRIQISGLDDLNALVSDEEQDIYVLIVGNEEISETESLFTPTISGENLKTAIFNTGGISSTPSAIGDFGNDGKHLPLMSADVFKYTISKYDDANGITVTNILEALFSRKTANNAWWDVNNSQNAIRLERGVARFEFRGNITEKESSTGGATEYEENFNYTIDGLENVKVALESLTPFNVNTEAYLFRHTSDGTDDARGSSVEMFGNENSNGVNGFTGYKWIASNWWDSESNESTLLNKFSHTANAYLVDGKDVGEADGNTDVTTLRDRKITEEIIKSSTNGYTGGYHPWCYVGENTLYSKDQMQEGIVETLATGLALKFAVLDSKGVAITYSEKDNLVLPDEISWSTDNGKENYLEITDPTTGKWVQLAPGKDGKYYLDYMACIRHNTKTTYGPMYYGVVRNNTYQVSISKLLGLPNPQEPKTMYLELQINVLSWVKRDVEFEF